MAGKMECPQQMVSVALTVVVIIAGAAEYGGVGAQSSGCATSLATLSPCMGYITSNMSNPTPSQGCCTALSSVVQSSSACLCQLFNTSNPLGIPINQTRALALPGACKITTPPLSQCNAAGAPATSPSTGSNAPTTTETSPSSSPATPNAVSPSSRSPSLLPPTTSVGGISPTSGEKPTSKAGALFAPSTIISALAVAMVAISIW
ncbi:non-specific lipid transfer protein GPI-anchored 15 isoform X1 [Cryptomeria japonica]|uniref:non-specific lipid transfer protein GPI-anchored 15 isoform X1 n=1 Tax=Cryptomeria japonica TaxID=3369 RepID=UPI0027DA40E4|nr:non-specific lipid transfer protein GPI-anchored 15 isoform X1 [Cryptomeria japonica]